ncbi:MAG TPA: MYXO-CTERM sorting domain-containing protein, partial [Polyangia bacterium]|nr:MYXO-CTERM sorting domain-containing protein [Polyangia bacterium]
SIDGGAPIAATVVVTTFSVTVPASLAAGAHTAVATETLGSGATAVSATSSTDHFTLVACLTNADCTTATAAFCSPVDVCVGCNGDAGSGATEACPTNEPYCALSGACGKCTTTLDCIGHPGGLICNTGTGACGTTCTVDADCNDNTKWCSAGVCTPKGTNGTPLPPVSPINGTCTPANGTRVCLSGVCDATNNQCGLTNSKSCGPPTTNGECDSMICYASDNLCGEPNGQACVSAVVCRSGVCFTDSLCGEPNGQPCTANDACRTLCLGADETCGLLNGSPCTSATNCRSNVCNADGHCGDPAGTACTTATTCRSAVCHLGSCVGSCATDADCAAADWCNANSSGCTPDLPNGQSCTRAAQCSSNVCNADGKCGDPDGTACVTATTCRSNACNGALCGSACTSDTQCNKGMYCDTTCKPTVVNGVACARAAMCASGVCNADGKCGNPNGQPCSGADVCRSNACDATGTCGTGCTLDVQCGVASYCDLVNHVCAPGLVNSVGCLRATQCLSGVCDTDGECGEPDGEPCGSPLLCRSNMCATTGVCSGVIVPLDMTVVAGDGGAADMGVADLGGRPGADDLGNGSGADMTTAGSRPAFSGGGFCTFAAPPDPKSGGWLGLLLVAVGLTLVARRRRAS